MPTPEELYPLCTKAGFKFVSVFNPETGRFVGEHAGYDLNEVEAKLGAPRFEQLAGGLKHVFCCNHRKWPDTMHPVGHPEVYKNGCEVHCIFANDLEAFLTKEDGDFQAYVAKEG